MKGCVWKNIGQSLAALAFLLAVWGIAYWATGNELLVPKPSESLKEGWALLRTAVFWQGVGGTLLRTAIAFLFSFSIALICAVLAYLFPWSQGMLAPVVGALRSLPVLAVLLILLTLFGAAYAPVAVAFLSIFPMLYTGILAALSGLDRQMIEAAKVCGTGVWRRATSIYLPLSAPYILRESGGALSFSLKLVISAEVLANTAFSLGGMMQEARLYAEIPRLFALVGVAFIVGLAVELLFSAFAAWAEKKVK